MNSVKTPIAKAFVAGLCIAIILGFAFYHFFLDDNDINAIRPGEKMLESVSPSGKYTITAYLNNGHATMDYAVLCVLNDGKHQKNIYYNYHCYDADVVWIDDDTVEINGVRLENVEKDTYDWRGIDD